MGVADSKTDAAAADPVADVVADASVEPLVDPAVAVMAASAVAPLTDDSPQFVIVAAPEVFDGDPPPVGVTFQVVVRDNAYAVLRINDAEYRLGSADVGALRRAFDAAFIQLN